MAVIKAASIPHKKLNSRRLLAELCYHYPQYTLAAARRLPAKDVMLLMNVAKKKQAEHYLHLTQIVTAPHTKNGKGVKQLSGKYKAVLDG